MKCLLQRVRFAHVISNDRKIADIQQGLLVFVGVEQGDTEQMVERMLAKILAYRIFADVEGKMNVSLQDIGGDILLVSQFTLAADTKKGLRPSFSSAAHPDHSLPLFTFMCDQCERMYTKPQIGEFGADMQVSLCNDGPVTFLLSL